MARFIHLELISISDELLENSENYINKDEIFILKLLVNENIDMLCEIKEKKYILNLMEKIKILNDSFFLECSL